jgi:hypothetical protein
MGAIRYTYSFDRVPNVEDIAERFVCSAGSR